MRQPKNVTPTGQGPRLADSGESNVWYRLADRSKVGPCETFDRLVLLIAAVSYIEMTK